MRTGLRRWWPILKLLLGLTLILVIGRGFVRDLGRLGPDTPPLRLGWLAASGLLYLAGLGCSAAYWRRLLGHLGARPPLGVTLRAYFLGHLGKYLPGKAWALALRAGLIHAAGVRLGLAALTSFYEVLTTMAAGALLAALLFAYLGTGGGESFDLAQLTRVLWEQPEDAALSRGEAVLLAALLLAVTALPLQPALFNRLARRLLRPFHDDPAYLPVIRSAYFAEGLVWGSAGWLLLGASLAAALEGTVGGAFWGPATLGRLAAALALSYVAGFVVLVAPGGLGVREFFLTLFLAPELARLTGRPPTEARAAAVLAVLVLRLTWTAAEALMAAGLYWLPRGAASRKTGAPALLLATGYWLLATGLFP
jgi:hypothetical protein